MPGRINPLNVFRTVKYLAKVSVMLRDDPDDELWLSERLKNRDEEWRAKLRQLKFKLCPYSVTIPHGCDTCTEIDAFLSASEGKKR